VIGAVNSVEQAREMWRVLPLEHRVPLRIIECRVSEPAATQPCLARASVGGLLRPQSGHPLVPAVGLALMSHGPKRAPRPRYAGAMPTIDDYRGSPCRFGAANSQRGKLTSPTVIVGEASGATSSMLGGSRVGRESGAAQMMAPKVPVARRHLSLVVGVEAAR
jgi:hypothetical protein